MGKQDLEREGELRQKNLSGKKKRDGRKVLMVLVETK